MPFYSLFYQMFYSQLLLAMRYLHHLGLTFCALPSQGKINGRSYNSWDGDRAPDYCCVFSDMNNIQIQIIFIEYMHYLYTTL